MINQSTIKSDLKRVVLEQGNDHLKSTLETLARNPEFCLAVQTYYVAALEMLIESIPVENIKTDDHFSEIGARLHLGVSRCIMFVMNANIMKIQKDFE